MGIYDSSVDAYDFREWITSESGVDVVPRWNGGKHGANASGGGGKQVQRSPLLVDASIFMSTAARALYKCRH